jgi:hypothetical protein
MRVQLAACSSGSSWLKGFGVEPQSGVFGAAFLAVEDERIRADRECDRECFGTRRGWAGGAGFVTAQVGDMDADLVGDGLPGGRARMRRRLGGNARAALTEEIEELSPLILGHGQSHFLRLLAD